MATPLTFAILGGAGGIAETHLKALKKTADAKLVGLSDLPGTEIEARLAARGAEYGAPWFTSNAEMLAKVKPDVAVIATPHPFHCPLTEEALAAGCHVLTEKPMAVEVAEADRMVAAADKAGKLLAVNFQKRYAAPVEHMKKLIDEGSLGRLIRVLCVEPWYRTDAYYKSATWRGKWTSEGGGVLMNQAPHTLDLICHLAGMPRKVWGWVRTRFHPMECEDSAQAMFEYADGAPGYLTVSTVEAGVPFRLQVIGEKGGLEVVGNDLFRHGLSEPILTHMRTAPGMWDSPKAVTEKIEVPAGGGGDHADVYADLVSCIRNHRQPRASGKESVMSLELANAVVLSSFNDGAPVSLPVDRKAFGALLADLRSGKRSLK